MVDLVVFLGNPGVQYEKTRHNVGWMVADHLPAAMNCGTQQKFKGRYATVQIGGGKVSLLWPQTFMNQSGDCVGRFASFFRIEAERVLVVHDELELPFGTIALRRGGGLGGHNGLRSIQSALSTPNFLRLRIGISRPKHGNVSSWVLSRFSAEEEGFLPHILNAAADGLEQTVRASNAQVLERFAKVVVIP